MLAENTVDEQVAEAKELVKSHVASVADEVIFNTPKMTRKDRYAMIDEIKERAKAMLEEKGFEDEQIQAALERCQIIMFQTKSVKKLLKTNSDLDGRSLTDIRELRSGKGSVSARARFGHVYARRHASGVDRDAGRARRRADA